MNPLTLIISEKPSVAKAIAECLGNPVQKEDYLQSGSYLITWALGHLMELYDAEDYNRRYKRWALDTLPIIPDRFRLKVRQDAGARKQYDVIRRLVQRPDVMHIINACDAGREGELIFRHLYHHMEATQPVLRLWLSSVVPDDIRHAMDHLEPEANYDFLASAAAARSESDWLVGINATRAYTVRCRTLLQLGRVQTPTLALIVHREKEIDSFVSQDFWEILADLSSEDQSYSGIWTGPDGSRISDRSEAQRILAKVRGQSGSIVGFESKETKELPPMLYNLTDLQKDANRRYGYTAQKTLQIAQSLYEQKRLITYPRTDSHHLSQAAFRQSGSILHALSKGPLSESVSRIPQPHANYGRRVTDNSKVTDHHAIIPTTYPCRARLSPDEMNIYRLVVLRFLSVFSHPARFQDVRADTQVAQEMFVSRGRTLLDAGWKSLYSEDENPMAAKNKPETLPNLTLGADAFLRKATLKKGKTKAPPRYTEGSLLGAMETAGKELTDEELQEVMKEKGIGTVASRPQIIEKLKSAGYIVLKKRLLHPTDKGIHLIDILPTRQLTSPELTGEWEYRLRKIERGQDTKKDFMADILTFTHSLIQDAKALSVTADDHALHVIGTCPQCGDNVVEIRSSYRCSHCPLVIWKKIAGKTLSRAQVQRLLLGQRVGPLKGFRSKTGKKFQAALIIKDNQVSFEFNSPGFKDKKDKDPD